VLAWLEFLTMQDGSACNSPLMLHRTPTIRLPQ
jgi:hypothetical protein